MLITDEQGVWEISENLQLLIEPTPEWIAQNQPYIEFVIPPKTELEILKEENESLKTKVVQAEQVASETNTTLQGLIELLIDMEVI